MTATDEKSKIEDRQREEAAKRTHDGVEWHPRLFRHVHGGTCSLEEGEEDLEWIINADIDPALDPAAQTQQVLDIYPILAGQAAANAIPPYHTPAAAADSAPLRSASADLIDL